MVTKNAIQTSFEDNELLTEDQAGQFLKFTPRALQKWRSQGGGPKYVRVSARAIRYRKVDLLKWAEERIRLSTSDKGSAA